MRTGAVEARHEAGNVLKHEVVAGEIDEPSGLELGESVDDAMGGENGKSVGGHVDEGGHDVFVREFGFPPSSCGGRVGHAGVSLSLFVAEGEGGFVAMVAVGDDEMLVGHEFDDGGDATGIGNTPEAVLDSVLVAESGGGLVWEFADGIGVAFVKHEDLAAVGAGGAKEIEAVGFRLGERLFVAVDDVVGVVLKTKESDESVTNVGGAGEIAGDYEALLVRVDGGFWILAENALRAPVAEACDGAVVNG